MRWAIDGMAFAGGLSVCVGVGLRFGVPEAMIVGGALLIALALKAAGVRNAADG